MSISVIERYKGKKKKNICEYAKILESIITLESNTLWKTKQEFNSYCKGIIDGYVEKYYFENNHNREKPIEYSNDNVNSVLLSIIEYYKEIGKAEFIQSKKNETFLLAVIICTASYIDIATNVIDGKYIKTKNDFKILLEHLTKTNLLKIYRNDKVNINKLFDEVKRNNNEEERFFNYYKMDNCYNEYKCISRDLNLYEVFFEYMVEGIEDYEESMVQKIEDKFIDRYLNISYELLTILILKELLMNKEHNTYLIHVTDSVLEKENGLKALDISIGKENIKVLLELEKYYNDKVIIDNIKRQGLEVFYQYDGDDPKIIEQIYNITLLVSREFKDVLKDNSDVMNHDIKLIVKEENKKVPESLIINKEEK